MRLSAVSYLNTKPFIYGLFRSDLAEMIDLSLDIPSVCAQKLLDQRADIVLTPVAVIPELPEAYLVSDFCIGSVGPVKTVCLYSEKPLEEIEEIYLDFHSRTSVELTKILCERYWKLNPRLIPAGPGYEQEIGGGKAGLIIGDRSIGMDKKFPYVYDLGEAWTDWTGLPFVFAAWISIKPISPEIISRFNKALQFGLDHIPELTKILPAMPDFDVERYFRENISYELDDAKWEALNRFLGIVAGENGYQLRRAAAAAAL
ncbi:MAG: menaquinone biosynthesis protein [Saprospiraceae bacterium]